MGRGTRPTMEDKETVRVRKKGPKVMTGCMRRNSMGMGATLRAC